MELILTGEDGLTLYTLLSKEYFKLIIEDLKYESLEQIWFRPSFGRGAGVRKIEEEKGFSGFGEPDAMIVGKDKSGKIKIVFLESKSKNIVKSGAGKSDLKYQFFLKLALINSIMNPSEMELGKAKTKGTYYCVDINDSKSIISSQLYKYYEEYKGKDFKERNNGWMIKKNSKNSPPLNRIETLLKDRKEELSISFYALGFTNNVDEVVDVIDLFENTEDLPLEIKKIFSIEKGLHIKFRNISIKSSEVKINLVSNEE